MGQKNPFQFDVVSVRLVKDAPLFSDKPIRKPVDAVALLGKYLCEMDREVLCVINVQSDGKPLNCSLVSIGSLNGTLAHPREMLKASILSNAAGIMLLHNHPSGSLTPSKEDTMITDRMANVCALMGISFLDHVIVGGDNREYFSFREKGKIPLPDLELKTDYHTLDMSCAKVAEQGKVR